MGNVAVGYDIPGGWNVSSDEVTNLNNLSQMNY